MVYIIKVIPELGQLNSAESRVRLAEINARKGETDFARMKEDSDWSNAGKKESPDSGNC